jgi:hypothetical protein
MKTETRQYKDVAGNPVTLDWLVKNEPEWAANQIRHRDKIESELAQARAALQPVADLLDGDLESVGGGTLIAPSIKVQVVKDAKAALSNIRSLAMSDEPKCTCRNQDTPWHESDCPQGAAEELAQERGEEAEAATETANRGRAC